MDDVVEPCGDSLHQQGGAGVRRRCHQDSQHQPQQQGHGESIHRRVEIDGAVQVVESGEVGGLLLVVGDVGVPPFHPEDLINYPLLCGCIGDFQRDHNAQKHQHAKNDTLIHSASQVLTESDGPPPFQGLAPPPQSPHEFGVVNGQDEHEDDHDRLENDVPGEQAPVPPPTLAPVPQSQQVLDIVRNLQLRRGQVRRDAQQGGDAQGGGVEKHPDVHVLR
mmetsp:Transcript_4072/g.9558  ORF Transcript_4072/g.9558 Transcript_4072/m.9558 type:complete len:220 (-) Transcript_4072:453-1112(-)